MIISIFIFFASSLLSVLFVQIKYYSNSDQEVLNLSLGWPNQPSTSATQAIARTGQRLQGISTEAPNFIMDDLNICKPGKSVGNFYQLLFTGMWLVRYDLLNVWIFVMVPLKGLINPSAGLPLVSLTITCIWFHPTNLSWRSTSWNEDSFQFGRRSLYSVSRIVTPAQIGISSQMHARVWMNSQRPCLIMSDFVRTQSSIKDQSPFSLFQQVMGL